MRIAAAVLLAALTLLAASVFLRSPSGYATQDRAAINAASSTRHTTGTDELGRDRTVRIATAFLIGLAGAVLASAFATVIAVSVGITAAFVNPFAARMMNYGIDFFLTLPWLFLLMMVRAALPLTMAPMQSAAVTFILLALLGWPVFARLNYTRARALRHAGWLIQARANGLRTSRLAIRHMTPHLRPLLLAQFLVYIPACLAAEANLGTLGLGISEPLPSWGSMTLALGNSASLTHSHWVYLPVVLLVSVLLLLEMLVFEEQQ